MKARRDLAGIVGQATFPVGHAWQSRHRLSTPMHLLDRSDEGFYVAWCTGRKAAKQYVGNVHALNCKRCIAEAGRRAKQ